MRRRRLVFSDASIADILEQAEWYASQSGKPLAQRWEKSVTTAISHLTDPTRHWRALQIPTSSAWRRKTRDNIRFSQASALLSVR